jgi:hypothetical protein
MEDIHLFTSKPETDGPKVPPAKAKRTYHFLPSMFINLSFFLMGAVLAHIIGW